MVIFPIGRKEIVEILLEAGMDPNSFDHETGISSTN